MPTIDPRKRRLMDDLVYRGEPTDPSDLVYRGEPVDATPLDVGFQRRPSPFAPDVGFLLEEEGVLDPRLDIRKAFRADLGVPDGNFFPATPQSRGLAQRLTQLTAPEPVEARTPSLLDRIRGVVGSDRFRGAAQGIAAVLRPTDEGTAGFLGSAANAFLASRASQDQQAAQREDAAQADRALALRERLAEAAERRRTDPGATTQARYREGDWIADPTDPNFELQLIQDPATGSFKYGTLEDGTRVRRPKAQAKALAPVRQQIVPTTEGYVAVDPTNPTSQTPLGISPASAESSTQRDKLAAYNALLAGADRVGVLLEERPEGVGLQNAAGAAIASVIPGVSTDDVTQRMDPEGVRLRAAIADVRTVLLNARNGGAVSEGEADRIEALLPKPTDTADAIRRKIPEFQLAVQRLRDAIEAQARAGGRTQPARPRRPVP